MTIVYILLPLSLLLSTLGFFAFRWSVKRGHLKDLDSPSVRMLDDE